MSLATTPLSESAERTLRRGQPSRDHNPRNHIASDLVAAGAMLNRGYVPASDVHNTPRGPMLRLAVLLAQRHSRPSTDTIITLQGGSGNVSTLSYSGFRN